MNKYESIWHLADGNSKRFRPLRREEVDDVTIPYFCIKRSDSVSNNYLIDMFNYEGHANAPRMPHYCNFILKHVLPNLPKNHDATGYYPIELHDTYTYLENGKDYNNALVFAKHMDDRLPCLVPDPYMIDNYGGRMAIVDNMEFDKKQNNIVFCGGTTGNTNPRLNQRLQLCEWSTRNRDFTDFRITNVVQMREDVVRSVYANFDDMQGKPLPQQAQCINKYILSIDGNTACWDRLMWIANSKSVAMKYQSKEILWYYPLFQEGVHYVSVDKNTLKQQFMYCQSNPNHMKWMISNANAFALNYANHLSALLYTTRLFENFAMNKP